MSLVRRHKISKISNTPLDKFDKEIVEFIESWLNDLESVRLESHKNSLFYFNNKGQFILEIKRWNIWIRYDDFWEVLHTHYLMDYDEVQEYLKYVIPKNININNSNPRHGSVDILQIETEYNKLNKPNYFF